MKKIILLGLTVFALASCKSLPDATNTPIGTWDFVDVDIDVKSGSPLTDRIVKTAFAAYTTLGGGMDQLRGTVKFDKNGVCTTPKFQCEYSYYGNTLSLKQKLLNAAGVDTKFTFERELNELYLTYDAKQAISDFSLGLSDADLASIEKANIVFIFRKH